jgi:hypothetical protein
MHEAGSVTLGDRVVVLDNPQLYGIGQIHHALSNGRLTVMFEDATTEIPYTEDFDAHELELFAVWSTDIPTNLLPGLPTPINWHETA